MEEGSEEMMAATVRVCQLLIARPSAVMPNSAYAAYYASVQMLLHLSMRSLKGFNVSVVEKCLMPGRLHPKTGMYDGCYGSLQQNKSDFYAGYTTVVMPDVLRPLATVAEMSFSFMSMYRMEAEHLRTETSVLDFVDGFTADAWLLTASTLLLLAVLLPFAAQMDCKWIRQRRMRRHRRIKTSEMLLATACILKQSGSFGMPSPLVRLRRLLILMTVACFFLSFYLTSMIKTTAVVYRKPSVIDTLQDFLDSDVRPVLLGSDNTYHLMRQSPKGSIGLTAYKAATRMGLAKSLAYMSTLSTHMDAVRRQKEVVMAGGSVLPSLSLSLSLSQ